MAPELDGAEREARIYLAAPIELADLERHFGQHIELREEIVWDAREQAVRARRERRLGGLVLETGELRSPDRGEMQRAALEGLKSLGLGALPWTRELRQWQARVAVVRALRGTVPGAVARPDR